MAKHFLAAVGDHARVDEVDQPVREHLRVHAEIVLVEEAREHRVGNGADAELQGGAVRHERRDVIAD